MKLLLGEWLSTLGSSQNWNAFSTSMEAFFPYRTFTVSGSDGTFTDRYSPVLQVIWLPKVSLWTRTRRRGSVKFISVHSRVESGGKPHSRPSELNSVLFVLSVLQRLCHKDSSQNKHKREFLHCSHLARQNKLHPPVRQPIGIWPRFINSSACIIIAMMQ